MENSAALHPTEMPTVSPNRDCCYGQLQTSWTQRKKYKKQNKKPALLMLLVHFPQQHIPLGQQRSPGSSVVSQLLRPGKGRKTPFWGREPPLRTHGISDKDSHSGWHWSLFPNRWKSDLPAVVAAAAALFMMHTCLGRQGVDAQQELWTQPSFLTDRLRRTFKWTNLESFPGDWLTFPQACVAPLHLF